MNPYLIAQLRAAEAAALEALDGMPGSAEKAHRLIARVLHSAEAAQQGARCAAPTCTDTVEYSGIGRPALYCSRRCRDRAAYAAKRQQRDSE
ncbi:MAG: hypothetical protein JWL99_5046 [Streptomyces oryziradicis]|nr:hypothetical protein [Actinacidiphila oryziradicis]